MYTIEVTMSRETLARTLDALSSLYPYGLPTSALEVIPRGNPAIDRTSPRVVIFLAQSLDELPDEERSLLSSIITKGLRIDEGGARIIGLGCSVSEIDRKVKETVTDEMGDCVITFGATDSQTSDEAQASRWDEVKGTPIIFTHSLAEIGTRADLKREFWGHVQLVLKILAER